MKLMRNIKRGEIVMEAERYTKEAKEFYQNMMEEIGNHKDFGKRNPIDIGIDCGYSEEEVMGMIQMCQNTVQVDGEAETYYFMLRKQKKRYIVSVNINDWKMDIVKELKHFDDCYIFEIVYDTAVWVLLNNKNEIFWENMKTGDSGEFILDSRVYKQDILILKDSVILRTGKLKNSMKLIKLGFDNSITEAECHGSFGYLNGYLLDGGDFIYCINCSLPCGRIYSIDKSLKEGLKRECEAISDYRQANSNSQNSKQYFNLYEVGVDNGEPYVYIFQGNIGRDNISENRIFEKFTLNGFERKRRFGTEEYDCLVRDFTTEHYQLLGDYIYTKENGEKLNAVCRFKRVLKSHQGVSIYSRDIFIGITDLEDKDETAIIKIDMQNDKEIVILPLEIYENR